jgi:hypothetical protein
MHIVASWVKENKYSYSYSYMISRGLDPFSSSLEVSDLATIQFMQICDKFRLSAFCPVASNMDTNKLNLGC